MKRRNNPSVRIIAIGTVGLVFLFAVALYGNSSVLERSVAVLEPVKEFITPKEPVRILFVGDMMFDRHIRKMSALHGEDNPLSCVEELLSSADIVVGNLEGPITDHPSMSMGSVIGSPENFTFTFPSYTAELLARYNIGIVSLGNNHIGNYGLPGIASTKYYLNQAGVKYFGGIQGDEPLYRMEDISFVSFNQFGGQSPEAVASVIATEKASGQRVIVYTHWGEEYTFETAPLEPTADVFVKSGASAIIGSHPHVIMPRKDIGAVPVYYSLGNFVFDQYWNDDVSTGLAVLFEISENDIETQEYRVTLGRDGRTCLIDPS